MSYVTEDGSVEFIMFDTAVGLFDLSGEECLDSYELHDDCVEFYFKGDAQKYVLRNSSSSSPHVWWDLFAVDEDGVETDTRVGATFVRYEYNVYCNRANESYKYIEIVGVGWNRVFEAIKCVIDMSGKLYE